MTVQAAVPWLWWRPAACRAAGAGFASMSRPAAFGGRRAAIGRAAASSPSASPPFEDAVLRHLDSAYNLARYLTRDADAAEDVVQEAVLKAFGGFSGFRGGDAKAWLLAIVRREVIDWVRARKGRHQVFSQVEAELVSSGGCEAVDPEGALLQNADIAAVRSAIESLPEPFHESIVLRDLEELSYRDIAEATGAPIGTVMSRLARGRELLARALRPASNGATSKARAP